MTTATIETTYITSDANPNGYAPLHPVHTPAKVRALAAALEANGWQGAPIVAMDDQAISGTHRLAAWRALGRNVRDIPAVQLSDLYEAAGMDYAEALAEVDGLGWYQMASILAHDLPDTMQTMYGIDID